MKYITIKSSYAKASLPMTPSEFLDTATMRDVEDVEACLGGMAMRSMVMVSRDYTGELQVVVIEPDFAISPDHVADATDWYMAIKAVKDQPIRKCI